LLKICFVKLHIRLRLWSNLLVLMALKSSYRIYNNPVQ
jgi:hypothetical protein